MKNNIENHRAPESEKPLPLGDEQIPKPPAAVGKLSTAEAEAGNATGAPYLRRNDLPEEDEEPFGTD